VITPSFCEPPLALKWELAHANIWVMIVCPSLLLCPATHSLSEMRNYDCNSPKSTIIPPWSLLDPIPRHRGEMESRVWAAPKLTGATVQHDLTIKGRSRLKEDSTCSPTRLGRKAAFLGILSTQTVLTRRRLKRCPASFPNSSRQKHGGLWPYTFRTIQEMVAIHGFMRHRGAPCRVAGNTALK